MQRESKEISKLKQLTIDDKIELAEVVKNEIGKSIVFGPSDWQVEHSMLSEGHENVEPVAKYYQAKRELYEFQKNIAYTRIENMKFHAQILEAQEMARLAKKPHQKLMAQASQALAEHYLTDRLVMIHDQKRTVRKLKQMIDKLAPQVLPRFPTIESAQKHIQSWKMEYRLRKDPSADCTDICLDARTKAEIGLKYGRKDTSVFNDIEQHKPRRIEQKPVPIKMIKK